MSTKETIDPLAKTKWTRVGSQATAALPDELADDICGFCGLPDADKMPHPMHWPGEESAGTRLVHAECEDEECKRAHSLLTDKQRADYLRTIR